MDAIEALRTRRCVRAFRREAVDRETLEEVVDCGRLAPTALNVQPWEFVVVTDKTMLQRIAQATDHGRFIADAGACIVVLSKATKYYLEDGSAATENILLACRYGSDFITGDIRSYANVSYGETEVSISGLTAQVSGLVDIDPIGGLSYTDLPNIPTHEDVTVLFLVPDYPAFQRRAR